MVPAFGLMMVPAINVVMAMPMSVAIYMMVTMVPAVAHVALTHIMRRLVPNMRRTDDNRRRRKHHARRLKYDVWSGPMPVPIVAVIVSG
jgi:hypothetical protein